MQVTESFAYCRIFLERITGIHAWQSLSWYYEVRRASLECCSSRPNFEAFGGSCPQTGWVSENIV